MKYTSSGSEVVELPEGDYQITVRNDACTLQCNQTLSISMNSNWSFPVISPNKDGIAEDYYIPYQGVTRIYDRFGVLRVQLPTPATWNATDDSGHLLPMGTYVIVCEGRKKS